MDSIPTQCGPHKTYSINSLEPTSSIQSESYLYDKKFVDFIEKDEYIKLFNHYIHLGGDPARYALKRVHLLSHHLGSDLTHECLVPFLSSLQKTVDISLLPAFCDSWLLLYKNIDEIETLLLIFKSFEFFLSHENPQIRVKATKNVMLIVESSIKPSKNGKSSSLEVVNSILCPMIGTFVESDWFPCAKSACYLIPKIYSYASEKSQNELRQAFQRLCDSETLTVKIAAAKNLKQVISIIEPEHAISMFWLVLKNMSIDNEEEIRMLAVDCSLVFAKQCTPEQNLNLNIPLLKAASEDTSWKVREFVGLNFIKIYETFDELVVKDNLFDSHVNLLCDNNDRVKSSSIRSFSNWSGILSQELIEAYVPILDNLAKKSNKDIRQSVCKTLALFAMKLKKKDALSILRPTIQLLLTDESMEVRLRVVENIHLICDREEFYGLIGEKLIETIDTSIENPIWRNRLVIAEQLTSFFSHFGATIFEQSFLNVLFRLLLDDVWKVRNAVLVSLEKICNECGSIWAVKFILSELKTIYLTPRQSSFTKNKKTKSSIRIVIIQALVAVAKSIDVENLIEHIMPLLLNSLTDSIPNIRFVSVNSLANIFIIYKNEKPELFLQAKCALIKLCQDSDEDVKYFAKRALDTYERSFSDHLVM
ncbi:Vacuolar 14 Fab1-binding region family protein [Theileria parva strain Muguga]|uniref:Serine/threonine protein phosphatase, putative n=1 Tax=Theileria parva TaxID=5875 RepID=Q4N283_THEPA|nr:Vacuolar 14 Fab1-binding region family protein [Theileria parva strain Muguga]EAN31826.1 Vacuolar 14 Fab1-binding region family protein [Theileria parva strain Muguga]|eukprot:XP_764109.1 Serine/threonine protein phosphatase [Theileria parva strain Muguga]